ncbi:MAG: ATPase [Xanthobacteraceae bacterium]|nr:ATPase [Xanthobacteraceae bacterium]MCW5679345.1 ATPase [Xanthobacteraceae bacterium]
MSEDENPMRRAQAAMRASLPKRFYKEASVGEAGGAYAVLLDGKGAKTPARNTLALPNEALARAVAAEWNAIEGAIDPVRLPLTRLANLAIDAVANAPQPVIDEIVQYAGSDLAFYRADGPEGLVALQNERWNPVLDWAAAQFGARFLLAEGVMHVRQPDEALAAVRDAAERLSKPFALTATASATNIGGSALIALALANGALSGDEAWNAAHVDEQWNISQWGEDDEAQRRLAARHAEFSAAAKMLALLR